MFYNPGFTRDRSDTVLYEKRHRVAYITLNRPSVLNAIDLNMQQQLKQIWDDFEADTSLLVAVLRGAGRAFCVGQDLKELVNHRQHEAPTTFGSRGAPGWPRLTERFSLSKPIIASVNGYAIGGGFELALACDIVVAAETAEFGLPEVRLGLVAGAGGVFRLVQQIPLKIAMGYLLTGRRIEATRAFDLGLVNEVVPPDQLEASVDMWVSDILKGSPLALRATKEAAMNANNVVLDRAFNTRYHWDEQRRQSPDVREGAQAFIEKRSPNWTA